MQYRDLPTAECIDDGHELMEIAIDLLNHLLEMEADIAARRVHPRHVRMRISRILDKEY